MNFAMIFYTEKKQMPHRRRGCVARPTARQLLILRKPAYRQTGQRYLM
jgi:hypothetical protein